MYRDFGPRKPLSAFTPLSPPQNVRQDFTEHDLKPVGKHAFFLALRGPARRHGRPPDRMTMTENIEVTEETVAFSCKLGDIGPGTYKGRPVTRGPHGFREGRASRVFAPA